MVVKQKRILIGRRWCKRFIIVDENGKTVDDAQHFGYKSKEKAIWAWNWRHPENQIKE